MMRKICFILRHHPAVAMGGAELQAQYIAEELVRRGWQAHYIAEGRVQNTESINHNGIILHWIKPRGLGSGLLNYLQLSKLLRDIGPNVIYQREALDYTGILGLLARRHRLKYLWAASSIKDCQEGPYANLGKFYKNPLNKLIKCSKFIGCNWLSAYGIRKADVAIVQSAEQQKLLAKYLAKSSIIVKNGLPIMCYDEPKPWTTNILWVANIKPLKRIDLFIKLAEKCEDLPANFLVIGRDEKEVLKTFSSELNELKNFSYLGHRAVAEVNTLLSKAALLVNTSDYEGFPNTFLQAWVAKTPVVSLNCDPDDVIKKNGLGFHAGNFDQMVKDVRTLIGDPQLCQQMGETARDYVIKEHDIRDTVNSLEGIIHSLS